MIRPDHRRQVIVFELYVDNDDPTVWEWRDVDVPARYEVCWRCRGTGTHDHPAFSNGISPEDFDEDPDFREDYLSGRYDVRCSECDGRRVTLEVDRDRTDPEVLTLIDEYNRDVAETRAIEAAERRMGA